MAEAPPPIVRGREYELGVLEEQIDAVRLGVGTVTLIEGAAGIGKLTCCKTLACGHPFGIT